MVGRQGVGKSTVMSILAGSRTGSGKPAVFRTESREVWEGESYQTTGIDMGITPERVILLDTQVWSCVVLCGLVWSYVVLCGPMWSCVAFYSICSLTWSCATYLLWSPVVLCGPVRCTLNE